MRDRGQYLVPGAVIPPPLSAPPPPPPSSGRRPSTAARVEQEIVWLTVELLAALRDYRVAKTVFAARTAVLERMHDGPSAESDIAGRDDYRRNKAKADCAWYRGEVMAASNALIALRGLAGGDLP